MIRPDLNQNETESNGVTGRARKLGL